ncbi:MAG: cation acetate symporter [Clostridiales bacterium]|nr:cation acetate symporter [Clostridiales bacterium]
MNYQASPWAIVIFAMIVAAVLGISFHFSKKSKSASSYMAAGGQIHWSVNGIAFAGDYLSAASFLGICGMIALSGYDGFLYSIGYLAGWIVALFVIAEPMKRMGKYTFTDAIDQKFQSKGIQFWAAISTLLVSMFYLIPQMVGAGALVTPLLGLPYWVGVVMVGVIVIVIVTLAGMTSTTYVQFLKGTMLIVFSLVLVFLVMSRGIMKAPDQGGEKPYHKFITLEATDTAAGSVKIKDTTYTVVKDFLDGKGLHFVKLSKDGVESVWKINDETKQLTETQVISVSKDGTTLYNGLPKEAGAFYSVGNMSEIIEDGVPVEKTKTLDPFSFIETIKNGTVIRWAKTMVSDETGKMTIYHQLPTSGRDVVSPGLKYKVDASKGATTMQRLDFISLMLALFCGTAALPHILIRYYTVPNAASARKSTIVAIAVIGLFYVLTLYMGLGAMVNGVIDLTNDNMSAPLLAKSFGIFIFAIISALAFATVLGTVSGLIIAASGAVSHDLMDRYAGRNMSDKTKIRATRIAAIVIGGIAILLGLLFEGMNVSYLVGWAFAIAASANLPAIIMILFWKRTTKEGVIAGIIVGLILSLGLILLSQETFDNVYKLVNVKAPVPINNPAIISVPLSFLSLVFVSLFTQKKKQPSLEKTNG